MRPGVIAGAIAFGFAVAGQQPATLRAQFAADPAGAGPLALVWLRREVLAQLPGWPVGRRAGEGFVVLAEPDRVRIRPTTAALPDGAYLVAEFTLPGLAPVLGECRSDGIEQWSLPAATAAPPAVERLLASLGPTPDGIARTTDVAALLGHVAPPAADGDPFAALLAAGGSLCGEATWQVRRIGSSLHVRGRSDGGLLLPAALIWLAGHRTGGAFAAPPVSSDERLRHRAFTARDGDRAEATRQLLRAGPAEHRTLRALLGADPEARVAAIDALVRQRAASALPRIVVAAEQDSPATVLAVSDAVRELWPIAAADERTATAAALQRSPIAALRTLAPDGASDAPATAASWRLRWFVLLGCSATMLFGFWQRERYRQRTT